ncbi:MAG TPA: ferric reductase-like transmembrane domain-containing protein [Streptosporangiaceae bacterium]|jgi:sulfoxide reductase heme-binding subunit YedZ|nr:ferric reductase-like transmembrane domain-containing protein [Streptosporangiaceae bacterium]
MAKSLVGRRAENELAADNYQPAPYGGPGTREPDLYPDDVMGARKEDDHQPQQRTAKSRVDEWMEVDFKFGGSRIKRKAVALVLLGAPALAPLFLMLPALLTLNSNTFAVSVDDTLGTGAEICLFLCLLVTPVATLTRQHWFIPLRRWYGIMMACCAIGDATAAGITDDFAGGVFGRLAGHVFELMGFIMVMLVIPLLITSNPWAQRKLGRYWKRLQRLTYAIWALLAAHLILLEGFGFQSGANGSGFAGDGDPIFHQRLYQYSACSLFLLTLRLPPVKRWIVARQKEGRGWLVYMTVVPLFALFLLGFAFIVNEEIFKGIGSFTEHPSAE